MGVGKGTIARALVRKSGMFGLDSDDLIESIENRKVKTIFKEDGEEYFRAMEKKTAKWLSGNVTNTIISTGGGFFKVDDLNKIGKVIYLKSSFDGIIERLKAQPNAKQKFDKRPLLKDMKKAKALFDERADQYELKADIVINVEKRSINSIIEEILLVK
ncbi:MAG TPA: shikimate kinase [Sulfurospirillum arcachonense]|nr:shikimate kinase [Sulfurospirillum arcachonense]